MMSSVPFSRIVGALVKAGYRFHGRRRYPDQDDRFLYLFSHPTRPLIGFPVVRNRIARKHFVRIREMLSEFPDEEGEENDA